MYPGYHVCKADFFEMEGGEYMTVTYKGPDTNQQQILLPGFHLARLHAGAAVSMYHLDREVASFPQSITDGQETPENTGGIACACETMNGTDVGSAASRSEQDCQLSGQLGHLFRHP